MTHFPNLKLRRAFCLYVLKNQWHGTLTMCSYRIQASDRVTGFEIIQKKIQIIVHVFIRGNVAELQIAFDC